jgi:hypothetical protein
MFGSPFNTVDMYCSPFQFEADFFGSLGSAFKYTCRPGKEYWVNPPFDETMLANAMNHVDHQLQTVPELMVMVIIPDWTGKYEAGEYLNWNGYKRSIAKTKKMEHQFYNYSTGGYQPACDCIIAVLSNRDRVEDHVSVFVNKWRELVSVSQRHR